MIDWIIGPSVEFSLLPPFPPQRSCWYYIGSEPQLSNPVNRSGVASPHLESSSSHQLCRAFTLLLNNINYQYLCIPVTSKNCNLFLVLPCGFCDLSSLTRDWTQAVGSESTKFHTELLGNSPNSKNLDAASQELETKAS